MLLEINHDERQLLTELLDRRMDEIDVEEHRSETWHYKDVLRQEQAVLKELQDKLERIGADHALVQTRR
jgi:hypothetical protein